MRFLHGLQSISCKLLFIIDLVRIIQLQFPHYIPLFEKESAGPYRTFVAGNCSVESWRVVWSDRVGAVFRVGSMASARSNLRSAWSGEQRTQQDSSLGNNRNSSSLFVDEQQTLRIYRRGECISRGRGAVGGPWERCCRRHTLSDAQ